MMKALSTIIAFSLMSATAWADGRAEAGFPMVDPVLDDPAKPWCYFTHPVTVIGMPWAPDVVQVTPEGNLFTTYAEFCLFWGDNLKPLACRQRHLLDGWIPVIQDEWTDGALRYELEEFGTILDGFDEKNTVQFVKITVRNAGKQPAEANIAAAIRHNGGPRREYGKGFSPDWRYEFKDNQLWRNGQVLCAYPKPDSLDAVAGIPYAKPFVGDELGISPRTEVGLAHYRQQLRPKAELTLIFKMPRVPVNDPKYLAAMATADYTACRKAVITYWQDALGRASRIHVPGEPLIEQAHRAAAVHVMLGTRTKGDGRTQTDGLPYQDLFTLPLPDYGMVYGAFGLNEFAAVNNPHCLKRQCDDGLFWDPAVSAGRKILTSHGQVMTFLVNQVLFTRDAKLGHELFPPIAKAVEVIRKDHETQPNGLMRPTWPFDAEMIQGQYTSHNYWALTGLRSAIRLARLLGENEKAADWIKLHDDFEQTLQKAVRASAAPDGYVPTGLCGFITGNAARTGFGEYQTDQDWENPAILWPTELVQPGDPLVAGTLKRLRDTKYREGIMTYRNGQHLHQYITTRNANQFAADGNPREALIDAYHILLHAGSGFESFENMIRPWTDRDVEICPPPHAWGCANSSDLLRNLFILEQGGRSGLDLEKREIRLFNAVAPAWLVNGKALGIENATTTFGPVTALLTPKKGGAEISLQAKFHTPPKGFAIRIPYFAKLNSFKTDARQSSLDGTLIHLSPDATRLTLNWTIDENADAGLFQELLLRHRHEVGFWSGKRSEVPKPPEASLNDTEKARPDEPLSFKLILAAWQIEYARRFAGHIKAGGNVKKYTPVPLQPAAERKIAVAADLDAASLTTGKPVTCSAALPDHPARLANDGRAGDTQRYWAMDTASGTPSWWQVDLGEVRELTGVTVVPFYNDKRIWGFYVESSLDGKTWTLFADKRDNKDPSTKEGFRFQFQPMNARYLRVTMTSNSANTGRCLVEVMAYGATP